MNKIDPKIFKAYDIRGVYPDEIDEDTVYAISRGLIEFLTGQGEINNRQFVVGRDFRLSSGDLAEAAIQGLVNSSVDVINIGQCSTPLFYWSIINEQAAGGLMITASHNPGQFNGLKVCSGLARSISSENGLFKIRDFVSKTKNAPLSSAPGKIVEKNLLPAYIDSLKQKIDFKKIKPLKIVIDCANGVMGPEIITLFKNLPCHVEVLYAEPDGNFSNHEPDPIKEENLVALKERILLNKADLGVAFDGDGDRIIFLDEKGKSIRGDFIIVLLAKELLLENPGEKILYGVSSSRVVPESIREAKGEPVLSRTGHSLAKEKMRDQDILFGGELTGHYFFRDLGFIENSLFVMLKIFEILSRENLPFSQLISPLKKYFVSGEINFEVVSPDSVLKNFESYYKDAKIQKVDGLTVEYKDWWFNLRKSNTESLVRLNLEANSSRLLEEKKKELINLINGKQ